MPELYEIKEEKEKVILEYVLQDKRTLWLL